MRHVHVVVQARGTRDATPLTVDGFEGDAYDRTWRIVTAAYPGYEVYRARTERRIPLFVLDPVATPAVAV